MLTVISDIAPSVLAFYMIVITNFLPEIVGCRLQYVMKKSMFLKHAVGLLLVFFLVVLIQPQNADKKLLYNGLLSCAIYLWFLLTTRSPFIIALGTLIIFLAIYILNIKRQRLESEEKADEARKALFAQKTLVIIAILLSIAGFVIYYVEKKREYKNTFKWDKFLIGSKTCANYTPPNATLIKNI